MEADKPSLKLSVVERLILMNQYRILDLLEGSVDERHAQYHEALKEGYELHYNWIADGMDEGLSAAECSEVLDILDMFRAIKNAMSKHAVDSSLARFAEFGGFDGNNESAQMAYVRYFCLGIGRFGDLVDEDFPFNSHMPMLPRYRRMRNKWLSLSLEERYDLSQSQLESVLSAGMQ